MLWISMNYIRNQQGTKGQKEEEEQEDTYDKLDDTNPICAH